MMAVVSPGVRWVYFLVTIGVPQVITDGHEKSGFSPEGGKEGSMMAVPS